MKKKLTFLSLLGIGALAHAQWTKVAPKSSFSAKEQDGAYYKLDIAELRSQLSHAAKFGKGTKGTVVQIPMQDGKLQSFEVKSLPVMDEFLAAQHELGSYVGVAVDDPSKYIRFSVAPNDFQSMLVWNGKYEFIEPVEEDRAYYHIHQKSSKDGKAFVCGTKENPASVARLQKLADEADKDFYKKSGDQKFHTLRLAVSVTGEYTAYFGGVDGALAQINATMTRVNGVFEQEFNVHLNVINAPDLIFTTASTDPYSNANRMCKWNLELMNVLHGGQYGVTDDDFDIGHLFGKSGGGGNAGCIGCIGSNDTSTTDYTASNGGCGYAYTAPDNYKGSGITSPANAKPFGDTFDIDYVAHEMGHQLGDSHTYSFYEGFLNKEMEPGSGSTIMGYAGITGTTTDVQAHSDPYFHSASIQQVQENLASLSVGEVTAIENHPPVVEDMSVSYTIPKSTAFVLTAHASDPDGDALTYCWEEMDASKLYDGVTNSNIGNTTSGASFRSWSPTDNPTRFFPKLSTVLAGSVKNTADFEAASTKARTTNFRVTVRDNKPGGEAQTAYATQKIVVANNAAFTVNAATGVAGEPIDLTWNVSGTNVSPFNAENVKIDYTTDNGDTWVTLEESVPNNGAVSVTFPEELADSTAIVRVSAIGNVFYAVNKVTLEAKELATHDVKSSKTEIYPNPVSDMLHVSNVSSGTTYEIHNVSGQLVAKGTYTADGISVGKLPKGMYVITLHQKSETASHKFIRK